MFTKLFLLLIIRKWISLPDLTTGRWNHECARITRFGHDFIVVIGGTDQTSNNVTSIEMYDLTTRPSAWEIFGIIFNFLLIQWALQKHLPNPP